MAVSAERIIATGGEPEVREFIGADTRVVDLAGAHVLPGLCDGHVHLLGGGLLLSRIDLRDADSEESFGRHLVDYAAGLPTGQWVLGGNWDEEEALGGRLPDRRLLDRLVPDRPVLIRRYDGHMAACNSLALASAGVGPATKDPLGGIIDRRPGTGEPTGILRDGAIQLVLNEVPKPTEKEIADAVERAVLEARRFGLTAVHDMGGGAPDIRAATIGVYRRLSEEGRLPVRVSFFLPLDCPEDLRQFTGLREPHVSFGGLKGFYDGSLGARTALMFEPYADAPDSTGLCTTPREVMEPLVLRAAGDGLSVAVHAIGDRAVHEVLDIFARVRRDGARSEARLRIEHAQHTRREDIGRFGELGVIASMQPWHAADDGRFAEKRLGRERCATSFAWRSLIDSGALLAFGSDWPVAPLDPLLGIDAAVTRRTTDGLHPEGWFPEECISVEEAVRAYSLGCAYAVSAERERGTIEPGRLADMTVLSRDILDPAERENIPETRVLMTMVGGRVWEYGE